MLRCSKVALRSDVLGHLRPIGDVGGTSALHLIATELVTR